MAPTGRQRESASLDGHCRYRSYTAGGQMVSSARLCRAGPRIATCGARAIHHVHVWRRLLGVQTPAVKDRLSGLRSPTSSQCEPGVPSKTWPTSHVVHGSCRRWRRKRVLPLQSPRSEPLQAAAMRACRPCHWSFEETRRVPYTLSVRRNTVGLERLRL